MKIFAFLFGVALFTSPFFASATIGSPCQDVSWCTPNTEYCNMIGATPDAGGETYGKCAAGGTGAKSPTAAAPTPKKSGSEFVPLAPIPGLTEGVNTSPSSMTLFLNNLYKFLIGFAAAAAVIQIIIGGLQYATQDSPGSKSDGKTLILQAILGLVLVLMPVLVFTIINPKILNLDVNWKAIALPTESGGTYNKGGVANGIPLEGQPVTHHGMVVEAEAFATQSEVNKFVSACDSSAQFHGYFEGGLTGWFRSGSECTADSDFIESYGSSVQQVNKCVNYKYTAYCSSVIPKFSFYSTSVICAKDEFGVHDCFGSLSDKLTPLDADSLKFLQGCASDGGVLTQKSKATQSDAQCPKWDNLKKIGATQPGGNCLTANQVYCRI